MGRLRDIVLGGKFKPRAGGAYKRVEGMRERYIADVAKPREAHAARSKSIAACGNGTAGAFAPEALRRMGAEVIELHTDLDWTFPNYNANPEDSRNAARHGRTP